MRIMPIFWGDITYHPLQGPAPKHGPRRRLAWPHGAPRPAPFPAGSASPTSSSAPSAPLLNRRTSAAPPPLTPFQPGPLRQRPFCFTPPRACSAVQPGVFRGSELRFGLPIISECAGVAADGAANARSPCAVAHSPGPPGRGDGLSAPEVWPAPSTNLRAGPVATPPGARNTDPRALIGPSPLPSYGPTTTASPHPTTTTTCWWGSRRPHIPP